MGGFGLIFSYELRAARFQLPGSSFGLWRSDGVRRKQVLNELRATSFEKGRDLERGAYDANESAKQARDAAELRVEEDSCGWSG
jgi:hypothetical protein